MTSNDLTRDQFDKLASQLRPIPREIDGLHTRADQGLDLADLLGEFDEACRLSGS